MSDFLIRRLGGLLTAITLTLAAFPAIASAQNLPTVNEVRTLTDAHWSEHAERLGVPGMIVAYAGPDGAFAQGYGFHQAGSADAVSAETSVFRVASVSKVFVGLAAAQMAERGQVDLDVDINRYLTRFSIDDGISAPITLRQLLTHQARLDGRFFGDSSRTQESRQTLGDHLASQLPPRIGEPNGVLTYSNYGYALAAFVLEEVSGQPFAQYVRTEILTPLGMTGSGYRLDDIEAINLAIGHTGEAGDLTPQPYTYVHRYPSTSMMVTAADMARFLAAMANGGCIDDRCILGPEGLELIYGQQATNHARLPGMTLAFMEWNGRAITDGVWHDGSHAGFEAELLILPESGVGFFVAANNDDSGITADLKWDLIRSHLPRNRSADEPRTDFEIADISLYEGSYQYTRRAHGNLEKIGALFASPQNLRADENGHLLFARRTLRPVARDYFESDDGLVAIAFRIDENGQASHFFFDWGGSPRAFARVPARENPTLVVSVVLGAVILMIAGLTIAFLQRRTSGLTAILCSAANLTLAIGFLGWFVSYLRGADILLLRFGEFGTLNQIMSVPVILLATTTLSLAYTLWGFLRDQQSSGLALNLLGSAGFLLVLNDWHLVGWNY